MPQIRNFADAHKVLRPYIADGKPRGAYTLGRMRSIMTKLGNPQDTYRTIHVAGTSGKTSTCYYMAALLQQTAQKVGLTVSPHVDEVNERVQINLEPLPEEKFCKQLSKFIDIVDSTDIKLSYFELLVAFAFWQFAEDKVDYAVVEVGLGGLLDGTNVIHSRDKTCIITDIGLDHTKVLGKTIKKIATQKAGIIQDHNQVFIYKHTDEVIDQIKARCKTVHAVLHKVEPKKEATFKFRDFYLAKNVFDFISHNENWQQLNEDALNEVMNLNIPARMEEVKFRDKTLIIDGSHNSQKMAALVNGIQDQYSSRSVLVLVSFVKDEPSRSLGALKELKRLTDKIIVTSFAGEQDTPKQSIDPNKISELANQTGFTDVKVLPDPRQAFNELLKQPEDLLIVTGSFYLLNHIRPLIM